MLSRSRKKQMSFKGVLNRIGRRLGKDTPLNLPLSLDLVMHRRKKRN